MHWHGIHLPAEADGGPHQPIAPGTTWSPSWRIDQPAATLWYHPHLHGTTADHVFSGLSGLFLVDDPRSSELGLPRRYWVYSLEEDEADAEWAPSPCQVWRWWIWGVTGHTAAMGEQAWVVGDALKERFDGAIDVRFKGRGVAEERAIWCEPRRCRPVHLERPRHRGVELQRRFG